MRYDLAFFLCCCKSFLGSPPPTDDDGGGEEGNNGNNGNGDRRDNNHTNYYSLLGVSRDATYDEIKRAYKRQSLRMHPDKLLQRGKTLTEDDQMKFTRMKEAYEVLSDPHKRETYDTIGERGMKWLEEPFSIDPQELAHNFAKSSVLDRSKIFSIFVILAIGVLLLPILICLHVDGHFGANASWVATLTPLWIWNTIILFYHSRVVMMGPMERPEHVPPEEWIDPLPMTKRLFSCGRFLLVVLFEILLALKLDNILRTQWVVVFIPLYAWEATTLYKKWPVANRKIVTVEDLELALGKPLQEFTQAEKEMIGQRYSVVPSMNGPEFDVSQALKKRAKHDMMKSVFRIIFGVFVILQLDGHINWSWWVVFLPFWITTFVVCFVNYQSFVDVQRMVAEKDPTLFDVSSNGGDGIVNDAGGTNDHTQHTTTNYGAMGTDGEGTPADAAAATNTSPSNTISNEEREELKAQIGAAGAKVCNKCCYQGFLVILVCLFVAKLQGASFSSFWIISPFLLAAGIILCCLGMAIFGITEVPTDGVEFDTSDFAAATTVAATAGDAELSSDYVAADIAVAPLDPELGGQETTPKLSQPFVDSSSSIHSQPTSSSVAKSPPIQTPRQADTESKGEESTDDDLD